MIIPRAASIGFTAGTIAYLSYHQNHNTFLAALIMLSVIFAFNTKPE